jgi:hypothetical protein
MAYSPGIICDVSRFIKTAADIVQLAVSYHLPIVGMSAEWVFDIRLGHWVIPDTVGGRAKYDLLAVFHLHIGLLMASGLRVFRRYLPRQVGRSRRAASGCQT